MPMFDWLCGACGTYFEEVVSEYHSSLRLPCPACDTGLAAMVWRKPPGMKPDSLWAGQFDQQLGVYVTSENQRRNILKERGLMEMGAGEFTRRAEDASVDRDPEFLKTPEERREWQEAAEKTWNDIKYGNVEIPKVKTVDEVINAPTDNA